MNKIYKIILFFFALVSVLNAQPNLKIFPKEIEFENSFSRSREMKFYNAGTMPVIIDSISIKTDLFLFRFDKVSDFPFQIFPHDTVKMQVILANYFTVTSNETEDTIYVYSNDFENPKFIEVKIDFFDDDFPKGKIIGQITDGTSPIANARVNFLYEGNYLFKSTRTNDLGFYDEELPAGNFIVAAEKQGYYVTFFGQQFDPFNAEPVKITRDSISTANIEMVAETPTNNSVTGSVSESSGNRTVKKGIVVVRKGNHTPSKVQLSGKASPKINGIYTAFLHENGTYTVNNIIEPGYYFVQAFSDYFVPSYYNDSNKVAIFWQDADSVSVTSSISGKNILVQRDSSVGAGKALGVVSPGQSANTSLNDVLIYARSVMTNDIFSFNFARRNGRFNVINLPFGKYELIAQKIGLPNAKSSPIIIDSINTAISDLNISFNITTVKDKIIVPSSVKLYQNYPNPFNPSTVIEFDLPSGMNINLSVFNILGERVAELESGFLEAGKHKFLFNAKNLSSGVYLVRLKTGSKILTKKIMLLK